MEKIKNLLNPGAKQDDEVLYGSGQSSDPVHSGSMGSGAGSHFGSSRTANTTDPTSSTNPTSTTGASSYGNDPTSTSTGGLGSSYDTGSRASGSRMPGSFDDDTSSTTAIRSGIPGQSHGGSGLTGTSDVNKPLPHQPGTNTLGSSAKTTAGPHSSNFENKIDPRVDSDMDGSRALGSNTGTSGSTLTGSNLPDRSVRSGHGNTSNIGNTGSGLGRDAAIGAAGLGAGEAARHHHGQNQAHDQDNLGSHNGRSFPLSGNSNSAATTTAGPHSSSLANKADPRVDSDLDGSRTAGNPGYGSNAPSSTTTGYGSNVPSSTTSGYGSGMPSSTIAGPHSSNLANKADPRVDSDLDGSRVTGNTGYGSNTASYNNNPTTGTSHLGRDAALGGAALGGAGLAEHERHRDHGLGNSGSNTGIGSNTTAYGTSSGEHQHGTFGHGFSGDPCGPEAAAPGPHFVQGPHATDTANKLDPHVSPTATGLGTGTTTGAGHHGHDHGQSTTATGLGSTGTDYENQRGDRHLGRDAAVGAAGVGAYEAGRNHPSSSSTSGAQTTTGPVHNSNLLNKIDPRVKQQDTSNVQGGYGISDSDASGSRGMTGTTGDHHYGRDAAVAGAVGTAGYEAEKHHHKDNALGTSGTSAGPTYGQQSSSTHHGGRDAALATGGTAAAYEAEKHRHNRDHPTSATSGLTGNTSDQQSRSGHLGRDAALATGGTGSAYEAEKHHHNKDQLSGSTSGLTGSTYDQQPRSGHLGRDATLGAGGIATAYEAEKYHHGRDQPTGTTTSSTNPSNYDQRDTTSTHTKRDAALGAGAGAGAAAVAGSEFSKKDAERDEKKLAKEESKHEKALEKDYKHQEKELQKEEKHHDKLLAKEEKKHEKALEKEEKKYEKEAEKEAKHDGKKGGIFGFLHRDKPDPELKEEEALRKETSSHERNRLHKDPPASIAHAGNTRYADEPQSGYASQVTGGTGTTALAQGDSVPRGSHMSGLGNKLDPTVAGRGDNVDSSLGGGSTGDRTIEPHTGLPIDYSKGDGSYGTDGTRMPARHTHEHTGTGGVTGNSGYGPTA